MADLKMPDINNVIIAGNLTRDPSLRKTSNGTPVANFSIASYRRYKDNNGQWREDVCYVGVVAWYKLAESCYENLRKGSAILVDGELQSRTLRTANGFTRNVVEIRARRIQFLDKKVPDETPALQEQNNPEASGTKQDHETPEPEDVDTEEVNLEEYDFGYKNLEI